MLDATREAVRDLEAQLLGLRGGEHGDVDVDVGEVGEVYACRINAGCFGVEWGGTRAVLVEVGVVGWRVVEFDGKLGGLDGGWVEERKGKRKGKVACKDAVPAAERERGKENDEEAEEEEEEEEEEEDGRTTRRAMKRKEKALDRTAPWLERDAFDSDTGRVAGGPGTSAHSGDRRRFDARGGKRQRLV